MIPDEQGEDYWRDQPPEVCCAGCEKILDDWRESENLF